jgi:protein phosphatase
MVPAPRVPAVRVDPPRLDLGAATSIGRVRERNEDSYLIQQIGWCNQDERHELAVVAVADGLGGYEAGDRASGMVIRTVGGILGPFLSAALSGQLEPPSLATLESAVDRALQEANRAILRATRDDPTGRQMGATVAGVLCWDGRAVIGHVGDCRVSHQRAGRLVQVTRDQTLVARMLELGQLTEEEALTHPARNEVMQAVGMHRRLDPARAGVQLASGDWLIVACDGLHLHVSPQTLQEQITRAPPSAALLAARLVDLANQGGGSDNCTVVVVRCA